MARVTCFQSLATWSEVAVPYMVMMAVRYSCSDVWCLEKGLHKTVLKVDAVAAGADGRACSVNRCSCSVGGCGCSIDGCYCSMNCRMPLRQGVVEVD